MQDNIEEKRITVFRNAPGGVRELYGSLDLGELLGSIKKRYGLQKGGEFVDVVGDIILGFYPKSELKKLLMSDMGLAEDVAGKIELDLKDFLAQLDGVPAVTEEVKAVPERLNLRPDGVPQSGTPSVVPQTGSKPLTREEVMQALAPKRTMASDIEHIQQKESGPVTGYAAFRNSEEGKG